MDSYFGNNASFWVNGYFFHELALSIFSVHDNLPAYNVSECFSQQQVWNRNLDNVIHLSLMRVFPNLVHHCSFCLLNIKTIHHRYPEERLTWARVWVQSETLGKILKIRLMLWTKVDILKTPSRSFSIIIGTDHTKSCLQTCKHLDIQRSRIYFCRRSLI